MQRPAPPPAGRGRWDGIAERRTLHRAAAPPGPQTPLDDPREVHRMAVDDPCAAAVDGSGDASGVDPVIGRAWRAWSELAGLSTSEPVQVLVAAESPLGPPGWIRVLAIGPFVAASVPREDLAEPLLAALMDLTPEEATRPDILAPRIPAVGAVLGPAALFYALADRTAADGHEAEHMSGAEVADLCSSVDPDELAESGLAHIESPAFVSRATSGAVVAACGYRRWPNGVAHFSVLTHPDHRRRGHGQRASRGAITHAVAKALLPQWRAPPRAFPTPRPQPGSVRVGAQLSRQPSSP